MSTKPTPPNELKQLQDDEAFINALYQGVEQSDEPKTSEILDKRIIAAAHKAVSEQPKKKKGKKLTWVHTLATAASLTLVVTLVFNQQSNILPPIEQSFELADESLKEGIKQASPNDLEMMQAVPPSKVTQDTAPKPKLMTYARKEASLSEKKKQQMSTQLAQIKSERRDKAAILAVATQSRSDEAETSIKTKALALAEPLETSVHKKLTTEKLLNYIALNTQLNTEKKYYWSLQSEQNDYFTILIFSSDSKPVYYHLPKADFVIDKEVTIDNKELDIDKISINRMLN